MVVNAAVHVTLPDPFTLTVLRPRSRARLGLCWDLETTSNHRSALEVSMAAGQLPHNEMVSPHLNYVEVVLKAGRGAPEV